MCSLSFSVISGCGFEAVSHFLSVFLLVAAVVLTVCFGVAAWRLSDERDVDITGQIPHQSYGWKPTPNR